MKKFIFLLILNILFFTKVLSATVNCFNGQCEFINSIHYKKATTYCRQTMSYKEVETDLLYFTVIETGERCVIVTSEN